MYGAGIFLQSGIWTPWHPRPGAILSASILTFEGPDSVGTQDPSCGQPRKPATLLSIAKRMNLHA